MAGGIAVAALELAAALAAAQGPVRLATILRFAALDVTLTALALIALVPTCALLAMLPRAVLGLVAPDAARRLGRRRAAVPSTAIQPAAAWLWALAVGVVAFVAASVPLTLHFHARYKEPVLIAASLAALQLAAIGAAAVLVALAAAAARRGASALHRLGAWNPFGRVGPACLALAVVLAPPFLWILRLVPQLRDAVPWRLVLALGVFLVAAAAGARRGLSWPREPARRRRAAVVAALGLAALAPPTLWLFGADPEAKYLAISASPPLSRLVDAVRFLSDFDRDGYGTLLGENDCAPWDRRVHPGARDLPDNGIDENCNGRDFSVRALPPYRAGERVPVPAELARSDWNFLLITVDTLRYDHTGLGGYRERRGRNTTPHLDALARRSVSFAFANAPSAGTMASIPAIQMSKFFHSGIALGPERRPQPPRILPENTTLGEVMKRAGYRTGAILSHEYFNDWGLEQGYDTFDNSLGAKPDPNRITSQDVTDKAQAWIARQGSARWLLWCHYIDPHGRYVAHPGETQFGASEEDLYDGEIAYADKHLGRLLDFLARSPAGERTVIVVTSDHGDGFKEHGYINHGMALNRELLHVPLVIHVPELEPRVAHGAVSPLDVLPTLADLAGVDVSDLSVEGESLVPELFYGRERPSRAVFAETNYPEPQRAAITKDFKLIFNLKSNVFQLFDLAADPWEKKNLWGREQRASDTMRSILDEWLDRVYFSRDAASQAQQVRAKVLLAAPPAPERKVDAIAAGAIQVVGWEVAGAGHASGQSVELTVYFKCVQQAAVAYRMEVELEVAGQPPARQEKLPADGTFPTNRWRPGEHVRESFTLRLPRAMSPGTARMSLRLLDERRQPARFTGAHAARDGTRALLGDIPVAPPQPAVAPSPSAPRALPPGGPAKRPLPARVAPAVR